ncbi:MAG: hypothetical protein ACRD26_05240 [Vicinamibacterales bacterium]
MRRALFAIVLAATASPAAAQPAPWAPERFTAGWVFTPSIVFGGLYDTNPTIRQTGNPISGEMVGLLSPRGEIDFNGRRAKFNAGYSGTLEAYRELDELTRYDQRGRFDARYQMTPRLLFQTRHQLTLTPTTDQLDIEGLPFTRVGSRMATSSGGFRFDLTPRLSMITDYMFQWVSFDRGERLDEFRFLRGGYAHSPTAEIEYALGRRFKVGALYLYRYTVIDAGEEVVGTHRAQGTVQYVAGPSTSIHGRAGFDHLAVADTTDARTGPSFGGGITQRIGEAALNVSYERAFVPSFGFGALTAHQVLRAGTNIPFAGGRAFVGGGVTYRRSDPVILRDVLVQLDSVWTQVVGGYSVARWLRIEGFVNVNHQVSSARGNVERTRVGIQFVTSKPVRIQ